MHKRALAISVAAVVASGAALGVGMSAAHADAPPVSTQTYATDWQDVDSGANAGNGIGCPSGQVALSGGFEVSDPRQGTDSPDTATWLVLKNRAGTTGSDVSSWAAAIRNTGTYTVELSVYVTCTVAP